MKYLIAKGKNKLEGYGERNRRLSLTAKPLHKAIALQMKCFEIIMVQFEFPTPPLERESPLF